MNRWAAAALCAVIGAVAWNRLAKRRNDRLVRPPVLDRDGNPLVSNRLQLSDGEGVTWIEAGKGPSLLLVPGADGMKETWRFQVPELARRFHVVAADLRSGFPEPASFDRFADDAVELLDFLEIESAIVIGQSFGGAIAMRMATRYPERVRGLVLANTLARVSYEHVGLNTTALAPVAVAANRYLPTEAARQLGKLWSRHNVWIFDSSPGWERVVDYALWTGSRTEPPQISSRRIRLLGHEDLRPELARIRVPTLVLKGPRDTYTPAAWARDIADRIPNARYVEIDDTGHCSHISMPEEFNRELVAWLDELELEEEGA
jgi:pimeloyl-ACP methyl ester carboxylesterase